MNAIKIFIILVITIGAVQTVSAQDNDSGRELKISDDEKIILFAGFSIAVIAIFLFLARDVILRKKTTYDKQEHDSKKDRTYEKYHSDWGDDYEEIGKRGNTKQEKEELEVKKKRGRKPKKKEPADLVPKIPKKRGRKPKGGKIIKKEDLKKSIDKNKIVSPNLK